MATYEANPNVTKHDFLEFIREYDEHDAERARAQAEKLEEAKALRLRTKDLRKRIKAAGHDLAAFDETRKKLILPDDVRQEQLREIQRNLEWLGLEPGTQASLGFSDSPQDDAAPWAPETHRDAISDNERIDTEAAGFSAGSDGKDPDTNPYPPKSVRSDLWLDGWRTGAAERDAAGEPPRKRRGGRPKGSKNRPKGNGEDAHAE